MSHLMTCFLLAAPLNRIVTLGFLVAAVPLLGLVALDLRRAGRASAQKKNGTLEFMSRYRDENGMPIFFEASEDPSARSAERVLTQKRRSRLNDATR